ncbi:MAG: hypothetical protein HFG27_06940 [Provencibacterium sp.]|nr:hypothetical protein [Provencibacterium sp.]
MAMTSIFMMLFIPTGEKRRLKRCGKASPLNFTSLKGRGQAERCRFNKKELLFCKKICVYSLKPPLRGMRKKAAPVLAELKADDYESGQRPEAVCRNRKKGGFARTARNLGRNLRPKSSFFPGRAAK